MTNNRDVVEKFGDRVALSATQSPNFAKPKPAEA